MEFKDYYKILGIEPDASVKEIKKAYRKLAHQYHPDMNPDQGAAAKFKEVAEAYQVLKDEKLRAEFDEIRKYGSGPDQHFQPPPGWEPSPERGGQHGAQHQGDFSDFFNSIFGGGGHERHAQQSSGFHRAERSVRGQDVEIELPVFLEETLNAHQKPIEFELPADGFTQTPTLKKSLKVTIPQGVKDGERIRLRGQGKQGFQGGESGDLYLHIRVLPHPLFDVHGHNIIITVPLTPWEAALGTKITVPTLAGKINLSIPANTQSGDKLRVKGKGLKAKALVGDMVAVIRVVMPEKLSDTAKELWQKLSETESFDPRKEWSDKP